MKDTSFIRYLDLTEEEDGLENTKEKERIVYIDKSYTKGDSNQTTDPNEPEINNPEIPSQPSNPETFDPNESMQQENQEELN